MESDINNNNMFNSLMDACQIVNTNVQGEIENRCARRCGVLAKTLIADRKFTEEIIVVFNSAHVWLKFGVWVLDAHYGIDSTPVCCLETSPDLPLPYLTMLHEDLQHNREIPFPLIEEFLSAYFVIEKSEVTSLFIKNPEDVDNRSVDYTKIKELIPNCLFKYQFYHTWLKHAQTLKEIRCNQEC